MSDGSEVPPKIDADLGGWQERLLKALRECGAQPAPGFIVLRYFLAGLVFVLLIVLSKSVDYAAGEAIKNRAPGVIVAGLCILYSIFAVAVLSRIRNALLRNAWRASARNAEKELTRRTARRPVFYLRSFAMDKVLSRRSWLEVYLGLIPLANTEQRVTSKLRKIGPVIAIGRPGEKLPQLGAARFYVPNELWQKKVGEVVRESQLVVWMSGLTNGLGWELEHLTSSVSPERFMLWAHPHLMGFSEQRREEEWRAFLAKFGKHFPKPLPARLGDARFFVFGSDWTPISSPPRMSAIFATPDISALKRAIGLHGAQVDSDVIDTLNDLSGTRDCRYLGDVIGARKVERDWPRLLAFAAALSIAAMSVSYLHVLIQTRQWPNYSPTGFVKALGQVFFWSVIDVAILAVVYRFVRPSLAAVPLGAAGMQLVQRMRGYGLSWLSLSHDVLQYYSLAFTVSRSKRLLVGLLLGSGIATFFWNWVSNTQTNARREYSNLQQLPWEEYVGFVTKDMLERWPLALPEAALFAVAFTLSFCIFLKLLPLASRRLD